MAVNASVGTCVSVSAAEPATFDAAGYGALTYTQVGELENIGDVTINHAVVSFANLCTGKTSTLKGAEEPLSVQLDVGLDRDDAGQIILSTARKSLTDEVSIKVTESNGDTVFFYGYVMSDSIIYGGIGEVKKGMFTIGVVAPQVGDTIVVVMAP